MGKAIDCAVGNLMRCSGLLSVLDQFEDLIPSNADDITSCKSISDPFCNIATKCSPCIGAFELLTRCIVDNTEPGVIDQPVLDLINSCPLSCDGSASDAVVIEVDEEEDEEEEEEEEEE